MSGLCLHTVRLSLGLDGRLSPGTSSPQRICSWGPAAAARPVLSSCIWGLGWGPSREGPSSTSWSSGRPGALTQQGQLLDRRGSSATRTPTRLGPPHPSAVPDYCGLCPLSWHPVALPGPGLTCGARPVLPGPGQASSPWSPGEGFAPRGAVWWPWEGAEAPGPAIKWLCPRRGPAQGAAGCAPPAGGQVLGFLSQLARQATRQPGDSATAGGPDPLDAATQREEAAPALGVGGRRREAAKEDEDL